MITKRKRGLRGLGSYDYDEESGYWIDYETGDVISGDSVAPPQDTPLTIVQAAAQAVATIPPGNTSSGFVIPPALQGQANQIIAQLARSGGQWAARQINGQTVLYRNSQGGIGTMNIQSMLMPAAIIGALFILGKDK